MTTQKPKIKLEKLMVAKELYLSDNPFKHGGQYLQEQAEAIADFIAYAGNNLEFAINEKNRRGQKHGQ